MSNEGKMTTQHKFTYGGNQKSPYAAPKKSDAELALDAFQAGDMVRAAAGAKRAIKKQPNDADAIGLLGAIEAQSGNIEKAVEYFGQALQAKPDHFKSLYSLGVLLFNSGQPQMAIGPVARAAMIDAESRDAKWVHARCLSAIGQVDAADLLYHDLVAADPQDSQVLYHYAQNHLNADRFEEAMGVIDQAIGVNPDSPFLLQFKGALLQYGGQFDEAETLLRKSLQNEGPKGQALHDLGATGRLDDKDAALIEKLLESEEPGSMEILPLYQALGQFYDRAGDFDKAADVFSEAEICFATLDDLDLEGLKTDFDNHTALASASFFEGEGGHASDKPVFITGLPRSGVALVEQIIAAHSEVWSAGEHDFVAPRADKINNELSAYPAAAHAMTPEQVVELGADYMGSVPFDALDAERITNRAPLNLLHLAIIRKTFPNAVLFQVRRHPLDICVSILAKRNVLKGGYLKNLASIAQFVKLGIGAQNHFASALPNAPLDVYYEELVKDSDTQARKIIEHTGLDWEEGCGNFYEAERSVKTGSPLEIRLPVFETSVKRFGNYETLLAPAREILADEIAAYEAELKTRGL